MTAVTLLSEEDKKKLFFEDPVFGFDTGVELGNQPIVVMLYSDVKWKSVLEHPNDKYKYKFVVFVGSSKNDLEMLKHRLLYRFRAFAFYDQVEDAMHAATPEQRTRFLEWINNTVIKKADALTRLEPAVRILRAAIAAHGTPNTGFESVARGGSVYRLIDPTEFVIKWGSKAKAMIHTEEQNQKDNESKYDENEEEEKKKKESDSNKVELWLRAQEDEKVTAGGNHIEVIVAPRKPGVTVKNGSPYVVYVDNKSRQKYVETEAINTVILTQRYPNLSGQSETQMTDAIDNLTDILKVL